MYHAKKVVKAQLHNNQEGHRMEKQNQRFLEKDLLKMSIAGHFHGVEFKTEDEKLNMKISETQGYVYFLKYMNINTKIIQP